MAARGDEGRENGEFLLMGTEFQFCKMKKVLDVGSGDDCTTM